MVTLGESSRSSDASCLFRTFTFLHLPYYKSYLIIVAILLDWFVDQISWVCLTRGLGANAFGLVVTYLPYKLLNSILFCNFDMIMYYHLWNYKVSIWNWTGWRQHHWPCYTESILQFMIYAEVIYSSFIKRALMHKKRIDFLSMIVCFCIITYEEIFSQLIIYWTWSTSILRNLILACFITYKLIEIYFLLLFCQYQLIV